jgi:hypothetical protein
MSKVGDGSLPAQNWLAAAERVLTLSDSVAGAKTARRFGTDWTEVLPMKEIVGSSTSKIVSFRDRRLPRWRSKIVSYVRGVAPSAIG